MAGWQWPDSEINLYAGIGYVWVTGASQDVRARIDNAPQGWHRQRERPGDRLEAGAAGGACPRTGARECRVGPLPHHTRNSGNSGSFRSVNPQTCGGALISTADRSLELPMAGSRVFVAARVAGP